MSQKNEHDSTRLKRSFLFLQGMATPFFLRLALALENEGHRITKINFCGGDRLFWNGKNVIDFRDEISSFQEWLIALHKAEKFTDIVLFGDKRPIHVIGIAVARLCNCKVHVFEEGYIRPNWVTLEENGVNGLSSLSRDRQWYLDNQEHFPDYDDGRNVGKTFASRAWYDIKYNLANLFYSPVFPHYEGHKNDSALVEYSGWVKRFSMAPLRKRHANRVIRALLQQEKPFFLLPLQLNSDAQILHYSSFDSIQSVITRVATSFAEHAEKQDLLLVKIHPLDTGWINYRKLLKELAEELQIQDRLLFIDGGHLPTLLQNARGVVTVNSTTGIQALYHKCPVNCLGDAIYDIEGLTSKRPLDEFWQQHSAPDRELFKIYRNAVIHKTQVNGSFYNERGMDLLVSNCIPRLLEGKSTFTEEEKIEQAHEKESAPKETLAEL